MEAKKIILTGDRPTGKLHIGHYVGSLRNRVELQNSGEFDEIYIMIADAQALTDNFDNPEKVRQNIIEVALDYLSAGLDPEKSTILIQSQIPELTEMTFYYMNLVTVARVQRNPTVKAEIQQKNFENSIPMGFFSYPISQAADITAFKGTVVPAGEDQEPMLEQTREIVRKFNSIYGDVLVEPQILLPKKQSQLRLPGTDGKAKMSKSLGNCIYLSDSEETVRKKVMSMFTDPDHLRVEDPGKVEGNPVFIYLEAFATDESFAEFWPEYNNLQELEEHYKKGGLGDVKVKKFLNKVLQAELSPIRERRARYEKDIPGVFAMLEEGSRKAEKKAAQTLAEMKHAMQIDYFQDKNLITQLTQNAQQRSSAEDLYSTQRCGSSAAAKQRGGLIQYYYRNFFIRNTITSSGINPAKMRSSVHTTPGVDRAWLCRISHREKRIIESLRDARGRFRFFPAATSINSVSLIQYGQTAVTLMPCFSSSTRRARL